MKTKVIIATYDKKSSAKTKEKTYEFRTKRDAQNFKNEFIKLSNFEKIEKNKNLTILHNNNDETQIIIQ